MLYFIFEGNFPRGGGKGLYLKRRFNGGFFALPVCGAFIWRGLYMEGHILGILRYAAFQKKRGKKQLIWRHIPSVRSLYACSLNQFFFRCSSHHHYFIISTSLPLFSQDLFELMHVLPQKSKFYHQAPFWKWKGAKFCINEFPRQWGWKEYPLTKSAE